MDSEEINGGFSWDLHAISMGIPMGFQRLRLVTRRMPWVYESSVDRIGFSCHQYVFSWLKKNPPRYRAHPLGTGMEQQVFLVVHG